MGGNIFFAKPFSKLMRHSFSQPARIDEEQRRTMLSDELHHAVVNFVPHFVAGDRTQSAGWNFDRDIELPLVTHINNHRIGAGIASKKMCNFFDGLLRRRKTNAHRRTIGQSFQPLE